MQGRKKILVSDMKNGESGTVVDIFGGIGMVSRLESLGVRRGVKILKRSALIARGPIVIDILGAEIAMGHGMASRIFVEVTGA
jgi:ferrous iron transport protein A